MTEIARLTRDLPAGDVIPLSEVSRRVGWSRANQTHVVRTGLIDILPVPPAGRRGYLVTREEALTILAAAALAFAAGLAVVTMLRAVRGAGLDVGQFVPDQA